MIDDELTSSLEEIGQRLLAVRPLKNIILVDSFPGQLAPPLA
jgi:hypothetical protein